MSTCTSTRSARRPGSAALVLLAFAAAGCGTHAPKPGTVLDEVKRAGLTAAHFKAADDPYFRDMDGGIALDSTQMKGRNTWLVWTGGNDKFWDRISIDSVGTLDYVKTLSSHPSMHYGRRNRWEHLGLVNEPCYTEPTGPDPNRYNLWLDQRDPACPPDPFADEAKYPGVRIGARVISTKDARPATTMSMRWCPASTSSGKRPRGSSGMGSSSKKSCPGRPGRTVRHYGSSYVTMRGAITRRARAASGRGNAAAC